MFILDRRVHFRVDVFIALLMCLFQGLGTDEVALIELLLTRTNSQIEEMKNEYPGGQFHLHSH